MTRARGKQHRPPEITPDSPEGHDIGLPDKNIPGGIYHQQNYPTVHSKPEVGDPLPYYRGMMAHGVPVDEHGVYDRADGKRKEYHPEYEKIPEHPAPVPVYLVEDESGARPLLKATTKHFQVPLITGEPESICGQDGNRHAVRLLNEDSSNNIRIGTLPELAVDLANNLIIGGALLPKSMTNYLTLETQGPLYALSTATSGTGPILSVIIETEVPNAG